MCSRRPQIMSLVCAVMTSLPFCSTLIVRFCGSPISSLVTIHGPRPLNVSKPFRMFRVLCMPRPQGSRWLMSPHQVTENVIERLILSHFPGPLADHGAEFALEIDEL